MDWLTEIASAKRREKDFRETGRRIVEIYEGEEADKVPFNILYSNVETLLPALYSQTPRSVVQRRFKDEDPLGKAASQASQRMISFLADTNIEGYDTFDQALTCATIDALVPGRGVTAVRYDSDVVNDVLKWEQVCVDSRRWDSVIFGYAQKWSKVPWIAYEDYIDREEAERLFGKATANKLTYSEREQDDDDTETSVGDADEDTGTPVALVYQIWDRAGGKKIRYVSPGKSKKELRVDDDPYQITGFFNCPRPLQFLVKANNLMPTAPYVMYENQAKELNNITRRIQKVVAALKVRGAYDASLGDDIASILQADDLDLVPTDNGAQYGQSGGLDRLVWMWPIDKLVQVLQQLVIARESAKRVIYEITGVSDIVRGQSLASETLGAQKIKEAWGTMRLKRMQKETQRYARDLMRIMLEVAANKVSQSTWMKATGLPLPTLQQKQQAQMILQQAQAMQQQPPPQVIQAVQSPDWESVLETLKNDVQRAYKIDIETNSTIDVEATEDQKNISEIMQAIAQFLHGVGPLVENGTMPFTVAQEMLLAIVRRFQFGDQVEDAIKQMQPPKPPQEPQDNSAAVEQMRAQSQAQVEQIRAQSQAQLEQQRIQAEQQRKAADIQSQAQLEQLRLQAEQQRLAQQAEVQRQTEQMKASMNRDTTLKKTAMEIEGRLEVAKLQAVAQNSGPDEMTQQAMDQMAADVAGFKEVVHAIITQIQKPKVIKRGEDGRAVSIGDMPIIRDETGRIASIGQV